MSDEPNLKVPRRIKVLMVEVSTTGNKRILLFGTYSTKVTVACRLSTILTSVMLQSLSVFI